MSRLSRLLAPKSIAVLGGAPAERVVAQCLKLGFPGDIWPVHPRRTEMSGLTCFRSLDDLPGVPDGAFVGVNRNSTIDAVAALSSIGAGGAVCYGSGFGEAGAHGLQQDLLNAAGSMPIFGPNCYGFVNTFDRVALWPDEHGCGMHDRGVAIVSQSGNVAVNLTFQQRSLRLGTMITVGNQAQLGMEDCIDALLDDKRITTIGLFLEAVRDPQAFARVALRARSQGVPIVALHTGRSAVGAAIATSHTGSMSGRATAYEALFARFGVGTVRTPAELLETLKLLDLQGPLRGPKVVSLSCSGGEASLVADHAEHLALEFAPFRPDHQARIQSTVDEFVAVSNPFDYHTFMWGDRNAMAACFTAVMEGEQDVTMLVLDAPPSPDNDATAWVTAVDALGDAAMATGNRAVVIATLPECLNGGLREHIVERSMVPLLGLHDGLTALDVAGRIERSTGLTQAPVIAASETMVLTEHAAKQRLRARGVVVPDGEVVARDGVEACASRVGYPVTLKALGVAHKSEAGAVCVGLLDADALALALSSMPSSPEGFLVESTVIDVVCELLLTVRRDAPVGWLISIGFGGVSTEVWNDVVHLLAPATVDEVRGAVLSLRSAPLLGGFRGRAAADVESFVRMVVQLSDAVVGSDVVEIECNPVLVGVRGSVAVDALMIVERL